MSTIAFFFQGGTINSALIVSNNKTEQVVATLVGVHAYYLLVASLVVVTCLGNKLVFCCEFLYLQSFSSNN